MIDDDKRTLIGVAQLDNCTNWEKNCSNAKKIISKFSKKGIHLVCFQEAYLSGYHASIFKKDFKKMPALLNEIKEHAYKSGVCVLFPTIEKIKKNYVSAAYIFNSDTGDEICYKQGLTPAEKTVMKAKSGKRIFQVNKTKFGILLCREMEDPAYTYLNKEKLPDVILWPSYWGWEYHHKWGPLKKSTGKKDKCFSLIKKVKRPLIQINMSTTIRLDMTVERYGKSVVVDSSNKKVGIGKYGKKDLFVVSYSNGIIKKL